MDAASGTVDIDRPVFFPSARAVAARMTSSTLHNDSLTGGTLRGAEPLQLQMVKDFVLENARVLADLRGKYDADHAGKWMSSNAVVDSRFKNNYFDGGGYTFGMSDGADIVVRGNRWGRNGFAGPVYPVPYGAGVTWIDNAFLDNGQVIPKP